MQVLCYCPDKLNLTEKSSSIKKFKYANYYVLKCYKIDFTVFFPEIFILFFIINIILIILAEINLQQNFDSLKLYCLEFIDKNNNNKPTFKELKQLYLKKNKEIQNIMKKPNNEEASYPMNNNNELKLYYINMEWDDEYNYYYLILIKSYQKNERKNYLIEEELNDLDYDYYINIEDRNWFLIFWSLFKNNYDLINTFFIFNN